MNKEIQKIVNMILLSFENELCFVNIINIEELANSAYFINAELVYPEHTMNVPLVYYPGETWIFTPSDWQGKLPQTISEIDSIEWRVNNTDTVGINFDGVPMLPIQIVGICQGVV